MDEDALKKLDNDSYEDIVKNKDLIVHTNIATIPNRLPPGSEECDFNPFFNALKEASYNKRIAIEGKISDNKTEIIKAIELMKNLNE